MSNCNPFKVSLKNSYPDLANLPRINGVQVVGDLPLQAFGVMADSVLVETTHADLVRMRDTNSLRLGVQYKITDYFSTLYSRADSSGISMPTKLSAIGINGVEVGAFRQPLFDIIVTATGTSTLSELGRCVTKGRNTLRVDYFNSLIVFYSLDNNRERFGWAREDDHGVIYRMMDCYGNDFPFDFTTIKTATSNDRNGLFEEDFGGISAPRADYFNNNIAFPHIASNGAMQLPTMMLQRNYGECTCNIFKGKMAGFINTTGAPARIRNNVFCEACDSIYTYVGSSIRDCQFLGELSGVRFAGGSIRGSVFASNIQDSIFRDRFYMTGSFISQAISGKDYNYYNSMSNTFYGYTAQNLPA